MLACAAHATIVLLPQFTARAYIEAIERYRCTWLTAVPPMIAMMLREHDLLARTDLSSVEFIRMGSAPVSHSLMEAIRHALPQASVTNAYGTTEAGPVVFGPHPQGLPQPEMSVGYPHPKVELRLVDGDNRNADQGVLEMKCPARHERLSQPAGREAAVHRRTASTSPATCSGATTTAFTISSAAPTTCSYPAARTSIPPTSSACWSATPMSPRPPSCRSTTRSRDRSRSPSWCRKPGRSPSEDEIKRFALANAPAYAHPRFVWFVEELPLASTNKVDRGALHRLAEERVAAPRR